MLHLTTFGGLTLQQDGENITGVATQRRQMALLALLAVAGDEGMSREKLLAYLWPEKDTERARHTLNQLLYMQRRLTDDPEVFQGRKTLRIYPELIETDVRLFRDALERNDTAAAVEIYRGPFLDGFFLDKAPAFEEWATEWRQRFARRYLDVLEDLAGRAESAGELDVALEWRRRAAVVDPLDPGLVQAYAEAFLACGNRPGALRVLAAHRERLKDELGIEPEPELRQMEDRIRNGAVRRVS
jgi:serine/threonine-protein kinase